jgi:hypothetical protein
MQSTIILKAHRRILSQHLHRRGCWKLCAPHWLEPELDLSGLTILTEAATGAYCVTPVVAALANADQAYALTRPSGYGCCRGRTLY